MADPLSQKELERVQEAFAGKAGLKRTEFLDRLVMRCVSRHPLVSERAVARDEVELPEGTPPDESPLATLAELEGLPAAVQWVEDELAEARVSPWFELARRVAESRDSKAFEQLIATLDSELRLRGLLYRHGLDPELELPGLWGRIWEAIPKWDGRDFRAYMARIVRNHCLDEIARKKRAPSAMDEEGPAERRPIGQTATRVVTSDALSVVDVALADLEQSGRIKPIDFVIFGLVCQGRQVADIQAAFAGPALPALTKAVQALTAQGAAPSARGPRSGKVGPGEVVALGLLLDGLTGEEVAAVTGRPAAALVAAAKPLAKLEGEDLDLAKSAAREGMSVVELQRAVGLNANALNLLLNRIRLKLWMAIVDRAYDALERRGSIDDIDRALVKHRCTGPTYAGCRMYKDRTCKREAPLETIARLGGLSLQPRDVISQRLDALREKVIEEGLGRVFPDYNACMIERKPDRASGKAAKS